MIVENLLAGEAQGIQIVASLSGLSSWHLYLDMLVLGKTTTNIKHNDPLVPPGEIITLGLQNKKLCRQGNSLIFAFGASQILWDSVISSCSLN